MPRQTMQNAKDFPWLQTDLCDGDEGVSHPTVALVDRMGAYFGTVTRARRELIDEVLRRSNLHDSLGDAIAKQAAEITFLKLTLTQIADGWATMKSGEMAATARVALRTNPTTGEVT